MLVRKKHKKITRVTKKKTGGGKEKEEKQEETVKQHKLYNSADQ